MSAFRSDARKNTVSTAVKLPTMRKKHLETTARYYTKASNIIWRLSAVTIIYGK